MPSGRTVVDLIPIEASYLEMLRLAVKGAGGQRAVERMADLNQATISRALNGRATYTTLRKLSDVLPGLPMPIVSVKNAMHAKWCHVGAELAEAKPAVFALIFDAAVEALRAAEPRSGGGGGAQQPDTAKLRTVVTAPLPVRRMRRRPK